MPPKTGTGKKLLAFLLPIIHKIVSGEGGNLNTNHYCTTRELAQTNRPKQLEGFKLFPVASVSIAIMWWHLEAYSTRKNGR